MPAEYTMTLELRVQGPDAAEWEDVAELVRARLVGARIAGGYLIAAARIDTADDPE